MPKRSFNLFSRRRLIAALCIVALFWMGYFVQQVAYTITGFAAKQACSLVNITQQNKEEVRSELDEDNPLMKYVRISWDDVTGGTEATMFGLFRRRAIYRPPLGAVVALPGSRASISETPRLPKRIKVIRTDEPFSLTADSRIDQVELEAVRTYAFSEPDTAADKRRTRALLAIWKNEIILEQYHPDYDEESLLLGWSMTKSILALAIGRRVLQGKMQLDDEGLRADWESDDRRSICLEDLLRMESGLDYAENYTNPLSDVLKMLTRTVHMGDYAASFPRIKRTNESYPWYYSSGTSNILSEQLRGGFGSDTTYLHFLFGDFLGRIGIQSAQLELDPGGTWVASSYLFLSARDWARLGKLALDDGMWNGQRLLAEGWMQASVTPTQSYESQTDPMNPPGLAYGMHWWLNRKGADGKNWMSSVPEDMFSAWGHADQYVTIIPSRELVVVRLGHSAGDRKRRWNHEKVLSGILEALPATTP